MVKNAMQGPWVGKIPWRRESQPPPVFSPGESHAKRSLAGYRPWGVKELDMMSHQHFLFHGLHSLKNDGEVGFACDGIIGNVGIQAFMVFHFLSTRSPFLPSFSFLLPLSLSSFCHHTMGLINWIFLCSLWLRGLRSPARRSALFRG